MKVSNFFFVAVALIFFAIQENHALAQTTEFTVKLNERVKDDKFDKSQAVVPVFVYKSDSIESYSQFGAETKKAASKFKIKLPALEGVMDTAYGFIYFSGNENPENKGYILMVITNYKRTLLPSYVYIDYNNNLDLSDDGPPDTFFLGRPHLDITLNNPNLPGAEYIVRLSRFELAKNFRYKDMVDEHYRKHSGSKVFAGTNYSFREQRLNMLAGDFKSGNDSFRIALQDGNIDGIFNEPGSDRLFIDQFGKQTITSEPVEIPKDLKKLNFERSFKQYSVTDIDPAGRFIKIRENKSAVLENALDSGKKISKFSFCILKEKERKTNIRKYRKKPVYLYFWNKSIPGFESDTAHLRTIHNDFGNKMTVIALNYGDNFRDLQNFREYSNIPYQIGLSTKKINQKFIIQELPAGVLLRKKLILERPRITPADLLKRLQNE